MDETFIVPSNGDGFVQLARTRTGTLFRKHLLTLGTLKHPKTGEDVVLDASFAKQLKKNFDDGVCPIVQIPLANKSNEHDESPDRNIGEVVDIEVNDGKVYGILDVRKPEYAKEMGKTLLGASAMLSMDYTDTKTGKKVGPTLLHSCVTNRPYVTDLDGYEQIVAATADKSGEQTILLTPDAVVLDAPPAIEETHVGDDTATTTETAPTKPSLQELLDTLKTDHNIDVAGLQAKATDNATAASLSQAVTDALTQAGIIKLTQTDDKTLSTEDVVSAVSELATNNVALTTRVQGLERKDAENHVHGLVTGGYIKPAQENAFVELKLTNQAMFDKLVPTEPVIQLSQEAGVTPPADKSHVADVDAEVERLAKVLAQQAGRTT